MIYLDNAASSFPKPPSVASAMRAAVTQYGGNPGRSGHAISMRAAEAVYACRTDVADLFGAAPENVVFTQNATHALNIALFGCLRPGDHVVMSDLEHNSVLRPVYRLREQGVRCDVAPVSLYDDDETVDAYRRAIRPETKMLVATAASNLLGRRLPVRRLGALAKERGLIFTVDAAQAAGNQPLSLEQDGIDILCAPGHKGLYGPQGSGVMVLSGRVFPEPLMAGGSGNLSLQEHMPDESPERYEAGTLNTPAIAGLHAGIAAVRAAGVQEIAARELALTRYLYQLLAVQPHVELYAGKPDERFAGILAFNVKGRHSNEVADSLDQAGVCVRGGLHCAPLAHKKLGTLERGAVRVSVGMFNTRRQMEKLAYLIKKII